MLPLRVIDKQKGQDINRNRRFPNCISHFHMHSLQSLGNDLFYFPLHYDHCYTLIHSDKLQNDMRVTQREQKG